MVKSLNAPYHAGSRDYAWVKLKREYQSGLADTFDLVVVGYERGQGRRASLGYLRSLLCCVYTPETDQYRTLSWVGSGLTDAQLIQLREALDAIQVPEKTCECSTRESSPTSGSSPATSSRSWPAGSLAVRATPAAKSTTSRTPRLPGLSSSASTAVPRMLRPRSWRCTKSSKALPHGPRQRPASVLPNFRDLLSY